MKKITIAFILITTCINVSFSQTSFHDTLKVEFKKLLWKVEYNFQENHPIWSKNELINRSAKGYIDFYSLAIMKDTINRVQFDVQIGYYTPKEMREKIKFFRENIISVLDELAAENKWTKKYEDRNLDKRQKRELGFMRSYDYYESTTGRKIISIFDRQKMNMELNIYGYPLINTADYVKKKEIETEEFKQISQLMSANLVDLFKNEPYTSIFKETVTTQKYAIRDDDVDDALRKAGFRNSSLIGKYKIFAIGFNLTDVQVLSKEWINGTRIVKRMPLIDDTEFYKNSANFGPLIKKYNLKVFYLTYETDIQNCGILGVSNKWDEKMYIEVYRKKSE